MSIQLILIYLAALVIGYLFGSLPCGFIIGKVFYHIDIREHGSKNIGGTNVGRLFGKKIGMLVIFLDALKIIIAFWVLFLLISKTHLSTYAPADVSSYFALAGACLGHCFSIYLKFKGGKAVATFAGCLFATNWMLFIIFILLILLILKISKFVSLASIISSCFISLLTLLLFIPSLQDFGMWPVLHIHYVYSIVIILNSILITFRHRGNINRLKKGNERKISWMK